MDSFSTYLFTYAISNQNAETVARVNISIMTMHACLSTTRISDNGSTFRTEITNELADNLGETLEHATTEHAQTIGMFQRKHDSLKKAIQFETGETDQCGTSMSLLKY